MLATLVGSVLTSLLLSGNLLAAADPPVVDTGYVKYRGNQSYPNTVAYLGIPYAEPPLGDLRFRAPLPLNTTRISQSSHGVIDATKYPDFCIQGKISTNDHGGAGSEDCLKVNIYAPSGAKPGSNLPVLVYIHGGGYIFGNPANWPFDHWVHQSPNVVIVSVYYRLDAFGFIASPEFQVDATLGDLNAGFLDQIEALRWVKHNIHSFGGNPNKVTINGESAGGSSVELHLTANEGEKLFSQAIAQSVYRTPVPAAKQQGPLFDYFTQKVGCGSGRTTADKMACLRKADVSALAAAQDAASTPDFNGSAYNVFHPVVDGKIITDYPSRALSSGKFTSVPLIVGATTNETLTGGPNVTAALRAYCPSIQDYDVAALEALYSPSDFPSEALRLQTLTGDTTLRCGRTIMAQNFIKKTKAWTYRYNQRNPTSSGPEVGHAAENWMMFLGTNTGINGTTTFTPQNPVEKAFASELIAYWLSFVRSGDPNTHKLAKSPKWPQYTQKHRARIVLQQDPKNATTASGSFIETEPDIETQRCTQNAAEAVTQQN